MHRLTVATFNVRFGTAPDGPHAWDHRWPLAGDTARDLGADVLCLQECLPFQLDHFEHVLSGYKSVGVGRDDGRRSGGEMVPILWRADRFELLDAGHFWLSPEPHVPGTSFPGSGHPRMVTWAALGPTDDPAVMFTVFNTHFDKKSVEARAASAVLLLRRVASLGPAMPAIVAGDFNCDEEGPAHRTLAADRFEPGDGLVDAYRAANPVPNVTEEGTHHQFTGRRDVPRIDWILVTPHWRVLSGRIDHTARDGQYPSDHFPVVAELELGR